jgi:predicted glycosyltransferase
MLAERGRIECVEEAALSPDTLAAAVDRAVAGPRPLRAGIDLNGARRSAELVAGWARDVAW